MSHSKKACGPHVELVRNDGVKITRCPCGTTHVALQRSGVTVQLAAEAFEELAAAIAEAKRAAEPEPEKPRIAQEAPRGSGEFLSVQVPFAGDKKLN